MCVCVATRAFFVVEATSSIFILIASSLFKVCFNEERKKERREKKTEKCLGSRV